MRIEANVSLRLRGEAFGTRVEIKNMNSFRSVERAIAHEIERQAAALDAGETLVQETRGWHEDRGETYRMRVKETSDDYRYFPEPDLRRSTSTRPGSTSSAPLCPSCRRRGVSATGRCLACRPTTRRCSSPIRTRCGCSRRRWLPTPRSTPSRSRTGSPASTCGCATGNRVDRCRSRRARGADPTRRRRVDLTGEREEVLELHIAGGDGTQAIVEARGFRQISDAGALGASVDEVLAANPAAVADYRAGKVEVVGFLVGQVMKATRGQANAALPRPPSANGSRQARGSDVGLLNLVLWGAGVALIVIGYPRARSACPLPGAQGAGRERRPLRGVAGGTRGGADTGASVAMQILRRQPDRDRRGCRRVRARVRGLPRALTPTGDPSNLDRGAAIHHDGEPRLGCNRGGLPVDDPELEPQTASPDGDRLAHAAPRAPIGGRRRRGRTGQLRRPPPPASRMPEPRARSLPAG